ncbi:hypothetical protein N7462_000179 [Penicillium macrosclerotiorum]|uniref:uncharacterized protein n=1 Tax=Penicillium macrosclerotiorum TaxID=303699 RepID=UPI002547EE27|nr:uncharacterized protein N7462_000179 [Penicillium macrosclerotiorum]KAJ5698174.1 hypothetical protein N7462_000179 [Penicillium macrosclerotiorum]
MLNKSLFQYCHELRIEYGVCFQEIASKVDTLRSSTLTTERLTLKVVTRSLSTFYLDPLYRRTGLDASFCLRNLEATCNYSGMTPCARCVAEACQCKYESNRDRRRKVHTIKLLSFHAALCQIASKLRAGSL